MTVRDDGGNVAVDYVWGNLPMQPNDDRGENTLDPALDNHSTAVNGYQGFPGYLPNTGNQGPSYSAVYTLDTDFSAARFGTETMTGTKLFNIYDLSEGLMNAASALGVALIGNTVTVEFVGGGTFTTPVISVSLFGSNSIGVPDDGAVDAVLTNGISADISTISVHA